MGSLTVTKIQPSTAFKMGQIGEHVGQHQITYG